MIPKDCKRLAEVDFPIAEVSRHSAREKSIRHGHPSTLHLWWARRPLAACRAMLLALLLPDPADEHCPGEFKTAARLALKPPLAQPRGATDTHLRQALLKFIADFANWDAAGDPVYVEAARALVRAAHGEEPPLVVDPFAGGGSIPLEALRLGCDAFASDLNPVACLIQKVMLEDIPRHGAALAGELRRVGAEVKAEVEKRLGTFYPPDADGPRPIAYLWARTVRCESPSCGAEIPLARSFWLAKKEVWGRKAGKKVKLRGRQALRYYVERPKRRPPEILFEIFEPKNDSAVPRGTVSRAKAACPACNIVLPPERVRAQLSAQHGGADAVFDEKGRRVGGARLLAVVTVGDEERGRRYRLPTEDYRAAWKAMRALEERSRDPLPGGLSAVPDEPLPPAGTLGFRVQRYGVFQWGDLFTARQKLALSVLGQTVRNLSDEKELARATKEVMGLVASRCADYNSGLARWATSGEFVGNTFGRQALPPVWEFCETVLLSEESGGYPGAVEWVRKVIEQQTSSRQMTGQARLCDACESPLPDDAAAVWFTDPPYYDAIPYSDLSDYFFVWLKRALLKHPLLSDPFDSSNPLTPKVREAVQDEVKTVNGRPKDRHFFEDTMAKSFEEGRRILADCGIACVVFAHKTTEGWEALLGGMTRAGWTLTASWPIASERPGRLRSQESAALATSVHLVCRPREESAGIGDWGDILRALPQRIEEWVDRLSNEGIRGADLVFACIGPALELFSRHRAVETPEGEAVGLAANADARTEPAKRGYLSYVWEVVGRTALARVLSPGESKARNGGAGALEEDARLTALFLWTVQSTKVADDDAESAEDADGEDDMDDEETGGGASRKKGLTLIYDVARRFAQPLGIHLDQWEGRIIETDKGIVRLLPVRERAAQLFGDDGAFGLAQRIETAGKRGKASAQPDLFAELTVPPGPPPARGQPRGRAKQSGSIEDVETRRDVTTLDRVHAAMLLQASGAANALRSLLHLEVERGSEFLRLANALSALYPTDSEEKRLLDAMLLAVPNR